MYSLGAGVWHLRPPRKRSYRYRVEMHVHSPIFHASSMKKNQTDIFHNLGARVGLPIKESKI